MLNLTEAQRIAIDNAYGKKTRGEDLTADEVDLIIAFEVDTAINDTMLQKKLELMENESQAKIAQLEKNAELSREKSKLNLRIAQAKLDAVNKEVQ